MATRPAGILNRISDRNGSLALLFALFAVLGLSLQPAEAQNCPDCTINAALEAPVSTGEWTLSKEVNEVNLIFLASHHGKAISDLSQHDIVVEDDGKAPAAIREFRTESELPLRVAMVIDTSSSVTSRFRFEQAAASLFLRQVLQQQGDMAFVMGFDNHPKITQDFVHDPALLSQGIERLHPDGGTALYDAVSTACQKLQERPENEMVARVLVVLSDGQNNAGELNLEGAIDAAERADVTIYAVSTNYRRYSAEEDGLGAELGNRSLHRLAEQTGGRVLMPAGPKEVSNAFAKIGEELRSRYAISYKPAGFVSDGRYRKIKIEARKAGEKVQIRARRGYYANPVPSQSHGVDSNVTLASR
jgi:Ca-activated chloride channel family protein